MGNFRLPALFFSHVCQKDFSCGVPSLVKDNNGGLVYTVSKLSMFREVSCVKFLELVYIVSMLLGQIGESSPGILLLLISFIGKHFKVQKDDQTVEM